MLFTSFAFLANWLMLLPILFSSYSRLFISFSSLMIILPSRAIFRINLVVFILHCLALFSITFQSSSRKYISFLFYINTKLTQQEIPFIRFTFLQFSQLQSETEKEKTASLRLIKSIWLYTIEIGVPDKRGKRHSYVPEI